MNNPHSKGVWIPQADTYVCACGIPLKWNPETRTYVPKEDHIRYIHVSDFQIPDLGF